MPQSLVLDWSPALPVDLIREKSSRKPSWLARILSGFVAWRERQAAEIVADMSGRRF